MSTETVGNCVVIPSARPRSSGLSSRHLRVERVRADESMPGRLMMTAFGWNDPGGGTTVPRLAAKELAGRGWEVTVFHAAVAPLPGAPAYAVREFEEDGVRLIAVHNRAHGLF